jgi:hypothetical protein
VILEDVHPLLRGALDRDAGADDFRQPIGIERHQAKPRLAGLTHAFRPWLGAEDADLQRQLRAVEALFRGDFGNQQRLGRGTAEDHTTQVTQQLQLARGVIPGDQ